MKCSKFMYVIHIIIAIILFAGVFLFAAYVYKFDPLSPISEIFHAKADVVWTALGVIVTAMVGVATVIISSKLAKLQESQAKMEMKQEQLFTEPHILVNSIETSLPEIEYSADHTEIKTLKGVDYPYYNNIKDKDKLTDIALITVSVVNTSEAFTRMRFNEASFESEKDNKIAEYNMTTFGVHENHIMIPKGNSGKIGFLIDRQLIKNLEGTTFSFSTYLDNNFNECFIDTQKYYICDVCDEKVSFIVCSIKDNKFERIR